MPHLVSGPAGLALTDSPVASNWAGGRDLLEYQRVAKQAAVTPSAATRRAAAVSTHGAHRLGLDGPLHLRQGVVTRLRPMAARPTSSISAPAAAACGVEAGSRSTAHGYGFCGA